MACCMKSIAISRPNSSPATRVNLLMMEHAPKTASKSSKNAVHTHTLSIQTTKLRCRNSYVIQTQLLNMLKCCTHQEHGNLPPCTQQKAKEIAYHPVHARNSFGPKSGLSFANLNMNVYISTVGSATPRISKGWPPTIECMIPQSAVDASVWTAVIIPSAKTRWGIYVRASKNHMPKLISIDGLFHFEQNDPMPIAKNSYGMY